MDNHWNSLREWVTKAKEMGELKVVEGVDPNLELSTIAQINARNHGPAILFEKIKGFDETGFRVLTNSISNVKLFNLTFGMPINSNLRETIGRLRGKPNEWTAIVKNYPVKYVEYGPVMENIEFDEHVNLMEFPAPIWHEKDGGPFIGTGVAVLTKDPETQTINSGCYRAQLFDRNIVGTDMNRGKHGRLHLNKYFEKNNAMPVVMVFGPDPLTYALAGSEIPQGISELEYWGAIMGRSMDVIRGKYTGLPIPAEAEIAIEGFIHPGKTRLEGPHGEWTGYYAGGAKENPLVEVKSLYYRDNAVILGAAMSRSSYNDHAVWRSIWKSALIYDEVVKNGLPNVRGVYAPTFGVGRQFIVISIKQSYPGHAIQAGYLTSQTSSAAFNGKWVVVVDDDIDPYDVEDVLWAICSRSDPSELGLIRKAWAGDADPLRPRNMPVSAYTNSRGIIFAAIPYERLGEFPESCLMSQEKRSEAFAKWSSQFAQRWKYA
jgi:4-hydroxy-3-polyprenylbenzoate decarboxylase